MTKPITVYVVTWASADHKDMGFGSEVFLTEDEALQSIRTVLMNNIDGQWDDGEYETQAEADQAYEDAKAAVGKMMYEELVREYQLQAGDDYLQSVVIQEHTLTPPPDVSSPDKIERFLET